MTFTYEWDSCFFTLYRGEAILMLERPGHPMFYIGIGRETVDMYRGNFKIEDYIEERRPVCLTEVKETDHGLQLDYEGILQAELVLSDDLAELTFTSAPAGINRFWMRMPRDPEEHCYGLGEQMSYFDLTGRHFPLWTSEPGVGRDKSTEITWRCDRDSKSGGDYYNTNYPQPTFISNKGYYLHVDTTAYADFDFRNPGFHEYQIWEIPRKIRLEAADSFTELLKKESAFFGRQPLLPEWVNEGLIIGAQGGAERSLEILDKALDHKIPVAALWCQDWCGKRVTSFGKRLQWDWHFHQEMYPDLPEKIRSLHERGIRFMGYINPYLVKDGVLYQEGKAKDVFAKRADGSDYLVDFGEFDCGVVDLTKPEAFEWFKNVIKEYMIGIGMDGWMADFGEYLPTDDIVLDSGLPAMIEHNHWPALWAKCNYEALQETGRLGDILYFMRAGGIGTQKYCTLLWAGDQSVDFSRHDGLCTTICAALSSGMTGCGLNHSDIGGYTSLYDNIRTKELFLRWAEMAAFTSVMRTHEGNRPDTNFQFYEDEDCMERLAQIVQWYVTLTPYRKSLFEENSDQGLPLQRPLFLYYDEPQCFTEQFEYLLGRDLLIAPVWQEAVQSREVYLPEDRWIHLWSGKAYTGGIHQVEAPIGQIPVFYREESTWRSLFEKLR